MRLASGARFFRSSDGRLFAKVPVGSRHEIYGLKSTAFRDWLIAGHFANCLEIPSPWAIRRVLTALEARARFSGETPSVFIRVGHDGKGNASPYYIDLGDSSGRAIEIGPAGWSVVDRPWAHFRRPEGLLALPTPSHEGSIELLRSYVNLSDRDFRLMIVWMAASLRPLGPHPILATKIFGGLLDAIAGGLRELPSIHLPKMPRMADFAAFGEAVGLTLGWPAGTLLADYDANRREASAAQLEDSAVGNVLVGLGPPVSAIGVVRRPNF